MNNADLLAITALAAECSKDPLSFVRGFFPWGEPGPLEGHDGPDEWQVEALSDIRDGLKTVDQVIREAIASGHGIGKSALVAWIVLWAIVTCEDTKGVVTANTENQLKTKTWAEVAKWHRLMLGKELFTLTATALYSSDPLHEKTWRIDMVPWSISNTEAFAGLHNMGKRVLLVFDEGSAIPDEIWEVAEGALTDADTQIIWCVFGNPTRSAGRFRECFGRFAHRWITKKIDSRTVKRTNKKQIQEWANDYGEDSDFFRVRVRGEFPSADPDSLFPPALLQAAAARHYRDEVYSCSPRILGLDVAREGTDSTVLFPRQGKQSFVPVTMRIPDTMLIASNVGQRMDRWEADTMFVDGTGGFGAGVIDALRSLGRPVIGVHFASKADDPQYFNKRSEMYFRLSQWLKDGGALPPGRENLIEELGAVTYRFQGDKFRICDKDDIKAIIGRSPDEADALALTFAYAVAPRAHGRMGGKNVKTDYNPLTYDTPQNKSYSDFNPLDYS